MTQQHDVVIVGTGFSGIAAAIELQRAGITDVVLLERADSLGGTWRDNTYPGCACDVPSHLYSFSFAPKSDWSRAFSPQPEIRAYLESVADRFDLRRKMRFGCEVASAAWDGSRWRLRLKSGGEIVARAVVMATGALSNPALPRIPGLDTFRGEQFHSARWKHGYDFRGKRVAVIGTGASAIQFVPQVQRDAAHVFLLQRTPPWILPRRDRAYSRLEKLALRWIPGLRWLYRQSIFFRLEGRVLAFTDHTALMRVVEWQAKRHIARAIPDETLRAKLTPSYRPGCKRILLSDDYYPALARPNVEVVTTGIREARENGLVLDDGRLLDVDVILHGTGFAVHDYVRIDVRGRDGVSLADVWKRDGAHAYVGTSIARFPNFFVMTGPNTGLGHNSMIVMIEAQARYVREALVRAGNGAIEPTPGAQARYNEWLAGRTANTVWSSGCRSWYLDDKGRNTTLWVGFASTFRRRVTAFHPEHHQIHEAEPMRIAA